MLVKLFAAAAAAFALMLSGTGSEKVASPAAKAAASAGVCFDGGPCPLGTGVCVMDGDCCPDCPLCPDCPVCCRGSAKATVKTAKSKPAACDQCPSGSKCCAK